MNEKVIDSFLCDNWFLSNFFPCRILYERIEYPTVEHAYQAAKTLDNNIRITIANKETPGQAKRAGKILQLRPDWEVIKLSIMEELLHLKFSNDSLKEKLLSTFPSTLIEGNTWNDTFWGVCKGQGQNNLGKLLMKIRDELILIQKIEKAG